MAALVHFDAQGQWGETLVCEERVAGALREHGLDHGRWPLRDIGGASLDEVRAAYRKELRGRSALPPLRAVGRLRLRPRQAGRARVRESLVAEHSYAGAELLHFLGGTALLYFRVASGHLALLCEEQDWVLLPGGTRHSFDAGAQPDVDVLRLLGSSAPCAPQPTGAGAPALPPFDAFVEELLALTGHAEDF